jgi:hypothetical protein
MRQPLFTVKRRKTGLDQNSSGLKQKESAGKSFRPVLRLLTFLGRNAAIPIFIIFIHVGNKETTNK